MNTTKQDKEAEVRYTRLFEAAQDGILLLDYPSGIVHDANPYICQMLGHSREELIGKEMWQLGFIADKEAAREMHDKLIKEGMVRYDDLSLQTKGGKIFESEFICNNYDLGEASDTQVIQCNIRDISDRRKAERALLEA
ncbi:PAS domain S-box protein, partial [Flavobacterium sp.]|uniref:PAS domain S-box protein n=1 Tax=Flavobacterium sp. TaxID=239 RepID=UPI0037C01558